MSLIDDALRRAAAEAARKEAARSGVPADWTPPPLPDRRLEAGTIWIVVGGVAIAALALALFWPRRGSEPAAAAGSAPVRPVLRTISPVSTREPVRSASAAIQSEEEPDPIASAPETTVALAPPPGPTPSSVSVPEPETQVAAAQAPEQPAPPTPDPFMAEEIPAEYQEEPFDEEQIGPPPGVDFPGLDYLADADASASPEFARRSLPSRTIVRERPSRAPTPPPRRAAGAPASVPRGASGAPAPGGGGKLELGGIVFSERNPVALINGRVVSAGSYVDGYEVVRVEATRVELRADDGRKLVLQLK